MDPEMFAAKQADLATYFSATQQHEPRRKRLKLATTLALPRPDDNGKFIKGPIPMDWMKVAARCGNRAEAVALLLWYAAGWQKSNPCKLTPSILSELAVHPKTAKRVLLRFQAAGLVSLELKRGASPVVALLQPVANCDGTA